MEAILGGLVGGLLALLGAFGVQLLTARTARRERIGRLGSEFLSGGAFVLSQLREVEEVPRIAADVPFFVQTVTAGVELSLVAGKDVALRVQDVVGQLNMLTLISAHDPPPDVWQEAVIDFGASRLELMQALRKELGRAALTDDELGHDPPGTEDPGSTHTPR